MADPLEYLRRSVRDDWCGHNNASSNNSHNVSSLNLNLKQIDQFKELDRHVSRLCWSHLVYIPHDQWIISRDEHSSSAQCLTTNTTALNYRLLIKQMRSPFVCLRMKVGVNFVNGTKEIPSQSLDSQSLQWRWCCYEEATDEVSETVWVLMRCCGTNKFGERSAEI